MPGLSRRKAVRVQSSHESRALDIPCFAYIHDPVLTSPPFSFSLLPVVVAFVFTLCVIPNMFMFMSYTDTYMLQFLIMSLLNSSIHTMPRVCQLVYRAEYDGLQAGVETFSAQSL